MNRRAFLRWPSPTEAPLAAAAPAAARSDAPAARAALQARSAPLTRAEARHLVTRLEFGARKRRVDGLMDMTPAEAVATILQGAENNALPEPPRWYKNNQAGGTEELYGLQRDWLWRMREQGFIEKLTLFWHNHLVVQHNKDGMVPHHIYTYYKLLRTHALGNFKELIRRIGIDPAMLLYLDGSTNEKLNASKGSNENYAREVLELFTMGPFGPDGSPNYLEEDNGQNDVRQLSRILTGWTVDGLVARPVRLRHDSGDKVLFGKTFPGSEDPVEEYNRFIDFLFAERGPQIAHYVCRKFYVYFVDPIPDEGVVAGLAATFIANDYEIRPVLEQLFTSERFLDVTSYGGCRIKSPVDFLVGLLNETETPPERSILEYFRVQLEPANLAMELFNPPNVAGWPGLNPPDSAGAPGDEKWITTGLLPERWNVIADLMSGAAGTSFDPLTIATRVSDGSNPFKIARDLADAMIPVAREFTSVRDLQDDFEGDLMNYPVPDEVRNDPAWSSLAKLMLNGTPHYDWPDLNDGSVDENLRSGARTLLREYISLLSREMPEYQLH